MLLTFLSTVAGLLAPFLSDLPAIIRSGQENKYKLEMAKLNLRAQQAGLDFEREKAITEAETRQLEAIYTHDSGFKVPMWVDAFRALVRPLITIVFFGLFIAIEVTLLYAAIQHGVPIDIAFGALWTPEVSSIFGTILGFWFGNRALSRAKASKSA